jgi:hypothetical protein
MAQQHADQHTRWLPAAKAARSNGWGSVGGLHAWGVGLNAWLVLAAWPWLFTPRPGVLPALAAVLALGALTLGAWRLERHPETATHAWLVGFPVLLGASVAGLPSATRQAALGAGPVLLGVLGLWAHLATSLWALRRTRPVTPLRHQPLPAAPGSSEPARTPARALAAALLVCGALAVGVVAPLWGDPQQLAARWGDAADEGALLCAVVAAALGTATAGPFLAAVLRPRRTASAPRPDLALRVASLLLLALLGAATYQITR